MRLIDADKILYFKGKDIVGEDAYMTQKDVIDEMPTVDAEPLRRGHWFDEEVEEAGGVYTYTRCSACGEYALYDAVGQIIETPYCPWCGAWLTKEVK